MIGIFRNGEFMKKKISPYLLISLSFIFVILFGAFLLYLPISRHNGIPFSFVDSIFMSTSSVCVTGLIPVNNLSETFTVFGKIVITLLVEIGGLGFVTLTIFVLSILGLKIGITDRFLVKESLNQNSLKGMVKLVIFAVKTTLIIQLIGAIINFIIISQHYSFWTSIGMAIFHSVASFNNAGFDIFPARVSVELFTEHPILLLNTSFLVIIGGIGFIVIDDLIHKRKNNKFSLHTKIVLKTTAIIIIIGTIILKLFEPKLPWLTSYITIVGARTYGLQIVDFNAFSNAAYLLILLVMFIGASPSSTAGGIKTTTAYTIYKSILAYAKGKTPVTHNREIASQSILKAFMIVVLSIIVIFVMIFLISAIEAGNSLIGATSQEALHKIIFEVISGYTTTGYTAGVSQVASMVSKLLLSLTMFFGRVGVITIISVWNRHITVDNKEIKYIEERIIVG